jgi:hypothetical protein
MGEGKGLLGVGSNNDARDILKGLTDTRAIRGDSDNFIKI